MAGTEGIVDIENEATQGTMEESSTERTSDKFDIEWVDRPNEPDRATVSNIKNKARRQNAFVKLKKEKRKVKRSKLAVRIKTELRMGSDAPPKKEPHTIDSLREPDHTVVEDEDEELEQEEATDSYAAYYSKSYVPKLLITCSDNPHSKTIAFIRELCRIIPGSEPRWRKRSSIKKMVKSAAKEGFTDIIVVNEDKRIPNGLLVIHLPEGPTALFRLSNVRVCKDIHRKFQEISPHRPEVILNNFRTRLGRVIARMLGALFHYEPEFKGRQVCTFHNQRDYIFFRHHRYEFKTEFKKVKLRELGPRFTLRLQWLQQGAFEGDYEWVLKRHDMETSRRRFFL
ncbi:ribosome production factor 1-like [Oratosquilla oratoria]|uniref:ribosome production factor 1-like n=1 Tax=Oratosquilla oratoria TaxID=337810 RepID=UPI003F7656D7